MIFFSQQGVTEFLSKWVGGVLCVSVYCALLCINMVYIFLVVCDDDVCVLLLCVWVVGLCVCVRRLRNNNNKILTSYVLLLYITIFY